MTERYYMKRCQELEKEIERLETIYKNLANQVKDVRTAWKKFQSAADPKEYEKREEELGKSIHKMQVYM